MTPVRRGTLAAAIIGSSIVFLDGTILAVAVPRIGAELPASLLGVLEGETYVLSGYLATLAAFLILGGALSDHRGRRRTFLSGLLAFGATSIACGLAPSMEILVLARLAQGVAGALLVPGSLAVINAAFDGADRGRAFGHWAAATSVVAIAGPAIGGILVETVGWRSAFLVNVPLVVLGAWLAARWIVEPPRAGDRVPIDRLGASVAAVAVGGLQFGIIRAGDRGWSDPFALVSLVLGLLAAIAFPLLMARRSHPLVPLDMFRERRFATLNLSTLLIYGALYTSLGFTSLFLQGALDYTALGAALALLPIGFLLTALSTRFGSLAGRVGARGLVTVGPLLMAGGMAWWARVPFDSTPWRARLSDLTSLVPPADAVRDTLPATFLFGLGISMVAAPLTTALMACVPVARSGIASAINNAISRVGQPFAAAVVFVLVTGAFYAALATAVPALDTADPAVRAGLQPLNPADPALGPDAVAAARVASTEAFHVAAWLCVVMLVAGAAVNRVGLPAARPAPAEDGRSP